MSLMMYYMLGTFYNNVYFLLIFFLIFFAGDEIFAVNGNLLQGLSHSEAIAIFKQIRSGPVVLQTGRRTQQQQQQIMVKYFDFTQLHFEFFLEI